MPQTWAVRTLTNGVPQDDYDVSWHLPNLIIIDRRLLLKRDNLTVKPCTTLKCTRSSIKAET